jgi:HlyD family secretion protein
MTVCVTPLIAPAGVTCRLGVLAAPAGSNTVGWAMLEGRIKINATETESAMGKRSVRAIVTLVLLAGAGASTWYLTRPAPVAVQLATVERGPVEETVANTRAGTVTACRRARLSPSIGGQIARLEAREGDRVEAGQLLLELWNQDLRAELELADSEVQVAKARGESACLSAEVAQREADRLTRLRKTGAASVDQTDRAQTEAKANRAECAAARAEALVSAARVRVAAAKLERTRLLAPFAGVVAEINGELNEFVTPSPIGIPTPPAVDLVDNTCFYVSAPIDEVDASQVATGLQARISLDAFRDQSFQGRVRRVADYVLDLEKQARTVDVEVEFINPEDLERLLAGYSADVEVVLDARADTLRIPTESVLEEKRVYVFQPETGLLESRDIRIGMANWDHTEVLSGLGAGERVVTSVDRAGVEDGARAVADTGQD